VSLRIALTNVYAWPHTRRGGERYLHELGAALQRAGHEVAIVSSAESSGSGVELGVPVHYLRRRHVAPRHFGHLSDEIAFGVQALGHLGWRNIDVWHALGTADAAAAAALGLVRKVVSVYTDLGIPYRWYRDERPDRRLHSFVVDHVDHYVCLSAAAAETLQRDFDRYGPVIGGGVDMRRFSPHPRYPTPVLLYSGALTEPRKRVSLLLEAVAILRDTVPDVQLWLSGPGDPSSLLASAPKEGRDAAVLLGLGQPEEQSERYGTAWATVLPSQDEAFGLALLESLACGTPVVAVDDACGPADLVGPDVGVVCAADAVSLAKACDTVLRMSRQHGIEDSCRRVATAYDWSSAIVPRMERLYAAASERRG
jgi:glycosyltransferase involved in cell wall biosynthesis